MPESSERKEEERRAAKRTLHEVGENLPNSAIGMGDGDVRPDARPVTPRVVDEKAD